MDQADQVPVVRVQPECRYGHGELTRENDVWAMPCFRLMPPPRNPDEAPEAREFAYTVRLWRCHTCGYIEVFDTNEAQGWE